MRGSVSLFALAAALATPSSAFAARCANVVPGSHAFAGTGEICTAPGGAYNPTPTTGVLPFGDPGYGFVAYGGGQLDASGAVTITTTNNNASAIYSTGSGSLTTLANGAAVSTSGDGAAGAQVVSGGALTIGSIAATTTIATTGPNASGVAVNGANSSAQATNVAVSTSGANANAIAADQGGAFAMTGGSAATAGNFYAVFVGDDAHVTLTSATLAASGANSGGVAELGARAVVTGSSLTIDLTNAVGGVGFGNNAFQTYAGGGTATISDSAIHVAGQNGLGVFVSNAGSVTLNNVAVSASGAGGIGVLVNGGASAGVSGGSIATTADNSAALVASGANGAVTAAGSNAHALSISTAGANSNAVQADGGGIIALGAAGVATTVTVSGQNAMAYYATGANSRIDATNVTATLDGGNYGGYGAFVDHGATLNVTNGSITSNLAFSPVLAAQSGGTATLNATAINASGDGGFGLWATAGGRIDGVGLTIQVTGGIDEASGTSSGGAANNGYGGTSVGGTLNLGSSSITSTGPSGYGVYTADGGVTTLTGDHIRVDGDNSLGVNSGAGGQTAIHGGTVDVTGAGAVGLYASGQVGPAGASGGAAGQIAADALNGVGLAVTTTGRLSPGVMAESGGRVSLTGRSVTTSGEGSIGLHAKGAGSVVAANNVAVAASGANNANAVFAQLGGLVTMTGGSATTSGQDSYVVGVVSGASARLTNVALTGTGTGGGGVAVNGAASSFAGVGLTIVTRGGFDSLDTADGVYNGSFAPYVGGGTVSLTNSTIATQGAFAKGVVNADGGSFTMTDGSITTSGATAFGVQARGGGTAQLTGVAITTTGAGAMGINVEGAGVTLTGSGLDVTTSGAPDSSGVRAHALYNGDGSFAAQGGSATLTDSRLQTSGDYASAVSTVAGGSTTLSRGSISTSGLQADAVYGAGGSRTTLVNLTLSTSANAAKGIDVNGAATRLDGSGLTISTRGTIDPATGFHAQGVYNGSAASPGAGTTGGGTVTLDRSSISTDGANAAGLDTANGGATRFTGGAIATNGAGSIGLLASDAGTSVAVARDSAGGPTYIATYAARANAVSATTGATVSLIGANLATGGDGASGLTVTGPTTIVTATDVTIGATGGVDAATGLHANAIYNGPGTSATGGGSLTLTRVVAAAGGEGVFALLTGSGGVTTATNGQFVTVGADAHAIAALGGGSVQLSGAFAATAGNGGVGLLVSGAGSRIRGDGVGVYTQGGLSGKTGLGGVALYNGAFGGATGGGVASLSNSTLQTLGERAHGVATGAGGVTTLQATQATTSGAGAVALFTFAGGQATVTGGAYAASGADAPAAAVVDAGRLTIDGASLTASGDGGAGLVLSGSGAALQASNLSIVTTGGVSSASGSVAAGLYNVSFPAAALDAPPTLTDSSIATHGDKAYGLFSGVGATTRLQGGSVTTEGALAEGVIASKGAVVLAPGASGARLTVATSGGASAGVLSANGGFVNASGTDIVTTGAGSAGLLVFGEGSSAVLSHVDIRTQGSRDSGTGLLSYGVYNGPNVGGVSGGSLTADGLGVTTLGDGATALFTGAGGVSQLARATLQTSGARALGVDVRDGGAVTLSDSAITTGGAEAHGVHVGPGSSAALEGANAISVTGAAAAALYVEAGGSAASTGPLTVGAASYGLYLSGSASGPKTSLTLNAGLSLTTAGADGAAITLSGDNVALAATGGGTIKAAGKAIALLNGTNQSASFANFEIQSLSGDLIFVDPASSTINFSNTTADAGTGNLANVTNNSQLDLNADASALTGVITLTPGSVANVTLGNGSSWLVTGNSTTTNLNVNNSSIGFSPDGGFKTLTTTNYVGNNALITFNAALGGAGGADQLVINGGTATGSTQVAIRATGTPTGSLKVPLIVTTNGATIAPDAFTLSGPVTAGGFSYALQLQDGGEYLISSQVLSPQQAAGSLASVAESKQTQAVTTKIMSSILTGATEQINCSSCSSGFASFGSFALGVHGRWTLNKNVSLLAGISYDNFSGKGVSVNGALLGALGLRYDAVQLGKYRPFAEIGLAAEPWASVTYRRSYLSALGESVGVGTAISRSATVYGRMGYIWRLSPTDEAAAYTGLSRSWTWTSGYTESVTPANPFGALMAPALDRMNIWTAGAQVTHLFGQHIEGNLSAGYARAFGASYGSSASINGFGSASAFAPTGFDWVELGGRVSYRFSKNFVADAFVLGTLGAEPAGKQIHGGVALRLAF